MQWTPQLSDRSTASFELRAYDPTGGFHSQTWTVAVIGTSPPPVISPIADQTIAEGQLLQIPIAATSGSGNRLVIWADNLPPGAIFDPQSETLSWQTGYSSAGVYSDVRIYATDGITTSFQSFQITVTSVIVAPSWARSCPRGGRGRFAELHDSGQSTPTAIQSRSAPTTFPAERP